jgi:D-lactate dehydrogenase (cytochrome)
MDLITDPAVIEGYLSDASNTVGHAEALARPRSPEEVADVLVRAAEAGVGVTVTARRTSTTGGPVPRGGWLLSTERLDRQHAVDDYDGGVILSEVQSRAAESGRLFPPDPTSQHEATLGAVIACNASGARSFRYGPARPWIEAVQVVLPSGHILWADRSTPLPEGWPALHWTEPLVKTAAGYYPAKNLLDLMIGQEGTLGVITRARVRLTDPPGGVMGLIAFFADLDSALAFVALARGGAQRPGSPGAHSDALNPRAIEYYDTHSLTFVRSRVPDVPEDAHCALFFEVEHPAEAPPLEAWWDALEAGGALVDHTIVTEDEPGRVRLRAVRHAIPAGVNERVVANGMPKVGTDFAVPDHALADMMRAYAAVPLPHVCFGHIGDNHLHLNLLPRTADELAQARGIYIELAHRAVALGGTVSAEHGIGKLKRQLLADMVGPSTLGTFHALKRAADPHNVLGRGTLLSPETP